MVHHEVVDEDKEVPDEDEYYCQDDAVEVCGLRWRQVMVVVSGVHGEGALLVDLCVLGAMVPSPE